MIETNIIKEIVGFVQGMRPGQRKVFPSRLSSEERQMVRKALQRAGLPHVGLDINPTNDGGGTGIYRPERRR